MTEERSLRFESVIRSGFNFQIIVVWLALLLFVFVWIREGMRNVNLFFGLGIAVHGILLLMFKTGMSRFEKLPEHHGTGMLDELAIPDHESSRIVGLPSAMLIVGIISLLVLVAEVLFSVMVSYDEMDKVMDFLSGDRSFKWYLLADGLCIMGMFSGTLAIIYTARSFRRKAVQATEEFSPGESSSIHL